MKFVDWTPVYKALLLLALLLVYLNADDGADAAIIWACLVIFYIIFMAEFSRPLQIFPGHPTMFSPQLLFLTFYYIVFYWPYQRFVLGDWDLAFSNYTQNTFVDQSNRAVLLTTIGLVAFSLGSTFRHPKREQRAVVLSTEPADPPYSLYVLLGQVALMGIYLGLRWRTAGEGRYTDSSSGGVLAEGVSTMIITLCLISAGLFWAGVNRRERISAMRVVSLGIAIAWALRLMLLGDRNSFLLILVAVVGGMFTFRVRAGRWVFPLALVGALLLYAAIETARFLDHVTLEAMWQAIVDPPNTAKREEGSFNITTITLRASIAAVPDLFDFGLGRYALLGLAGVLPFIRGIIVGDHEGFLTTSNLLTNVVLKPDSTWGVGTNIISDTYMDFGVPGVVITMFLLGLFVRSICQWASRSPGATPTVVFYVLTLALFAELPRYGVGFPVRILAWAAVLLWGVRLLHTRDRGSDRIGRKGTGRSSPLERGRV
jgi:hypothetical protein